MSYLPQSDSDRSAMLATLGIQDEEELFGDIPAAVRERGMPDIPGPLTEPELLRHMSRLARDNSSLAELACFAGGGIYDRFVPSIVQSVVSRPEFLTPYTPYQAETSQGTLQGMFEYQTMICELTGMDVANASLYDGATAVAEAVLMAARISGRRRALISRALSPASRRVVRTYCSAADVEIVEIPYVDETGETDLAALAELVDDGTSCVVLQQPNYFGVLEEMAGAGEAAHAVGALLVAAVEPVSLGLLKPPGEYEADIAVGEGQPLGLAPGFGGPLLGLLACGEEFMRHMPGRVVGETTDASGRTGYCLTLQAREQHIRRGKATSNICTSQTLCALAATVYLAALGPHGLREAAQSGAEKAQYLHDCLARAGGLEPRFSGSFLDEFALRVPAPAAALVQRVCEQGYLVGPTLGRDYPELEDCVLVAVTEERTREEIEGLVAALTDGGGEA